MTTYINEDKIDTFPLLWNMTKEISRDEGMNTGSIVGRYASIIDDRINNSGWSRSTDSLKLYTRQQLQEELDERDDASI